MRVTNRLLMGLACSALCITVAGCSAHEQSYSPTSQTQNFYLTNVPATQLATVIASNASSGDVSANDIFIVSNVPTAEWEYEEEPEGRIEKEKALSCKTNVCGTIQAEKYSKELAEHVAAKVKASNAKLDITPNTKYTDMKKGDVTEIMHPLTEGKLSIPIRKLTDNDETKGVLVFSALNEAGESVIGRDTAIEMDEVFSVKNKRHPEGKPILDAVHEIVGKEFSPGIDGEEKIILVALPKAYLPDGVLAFVIRSDEYPKSEYAYSNEGEIVYFNAEQPIEQVVGTMAHEFSHLCSYNQKLILDGEYTGTDEDKVLEEGKADFAMDYCGFSINGGIYEDGEKIEDLSSSILLGHVSNYLDLPNEGSLLELNEKYSTISYGEGYLLYRYIADRFGDEAVKRAATSRMVGRENLAKFTGVPFNELFDDFTVANVCSGLNNADKKYDYKSFSLRGTYNKTDDNSAYVLNGPAFEPVEMDKTHLTKQYIMKPWSTNYYSFGYKDLVKKLHIGVSAPGADSIFHLMMTEDNIIRKLLSPSEEEQ